MRATNPPSPRAYEGTPVHTVHPTLLIGPSDWQSDHMPRIEFARRIDAMWQSHASAKRAIV
jgi:hypothetical protein